MAYTTINKSTDYFNTKLYTGTEPSNKAVTGVGFQPDLVWIKQRSGTESHHIEDAVRGVENTIRSNLSDAQVDRGSNGIQSFDSDGFTAGGGDDINSNGGTFASWNWKANGSGSSNTDGSITSTVSVNTTAGFSIVKYVGNNTAGATVGHGLGVVPEMIIIKQTTGSTNWLVYHKAVPATQFLYLNSTDAATTDNAAFNNTAPTSSVFSLGTLVAGNAASGSTYIAYCFAPKTGYSKFGSYTGNGNADGTFVYTGFKPSFYMVKQTNTSGEGWFMWDNKRSSVSGANVNNRYLVANNTSADGTLGVNCDFLSNGVKTRYGSSATNASGGTYIYMAFGQTLVGSNNVPCTAR